MMNILIALALMAAGNIFYITYYGEMKRKRKP